ncbi:hypothetical protein L6452_06449 [Arctium lappa]|uniref:Uncharacterized protein n=1 Tax=Arctium lappa TaxID=4217 RepID=A0ACB9EK86_ARCLA|nr:hypothetical protein L6452_06449 [Arctium lappa]
MLEEQLVLPGELVLQDECYCYHVSIADDKKILLEELMLLMLIRMNNAASMINTASMVSTAEEINAARRLMLLLTILKIMLIKMD